MTVCFVENDMHDFTQFLKNLCANQILVNQIIFLSHDSNPQLYKIILQGVELLPALWPQIFPLRGIRAETIPAMN